MWRKILVEGIPPRFNHGACAIGRHMVVFGGWKDEDTFRNDVWIFDTEQGQWHEIMCTENIPSKRYGHSVAVLDSRMFVVAGYSQSLEYLNDMHVLHTFLCSYERTLHVDLYRMWQGSANKLLKS